MCGRSAPQGTRRGRSGSSLLRSGSIDTFGQSPDVGATHLLLRKAGGGHSGDESRIDLADVDAQPPALLGAVLVVDERAPDRVSHLLKRGDRMLGLKDGWATPRQAEVRPAGQ